MARLPDGIVTLLFTDVERSTRLLQELGDAYRQVLEDSRRLQRRAVAEHGGSEIDCPGDEFFAAFDDAPAAIAAAEQAQRSIRAHRWASSRPVRVRMGVHSGQPRIGEEGYVGLDVRRAARIASAAHGGQVLVSEQARELLPDAPMRDLGRFRLRDLAEPEHLFQLGAQGLTADFPPLRFAEPEGSPLRVVLADDSILLREGVARLLEEAGFEIVAQSGNADDALRHVAMHRPDVALLDIRMPPTHTDEGLRAAKQIRERFPEVGVLVLSQYVEPAYALELLSESAEGVGYLLKDRVSDIEEFAASVRRVAEGGSALDPTVVSELVGRRRKENPLDDLSPREREVLELMAEGRSNQAISQRLYVTPRAVRST